mgnify:CR=1 FL=1
MNRKNTFFSRKVFKTPLRSKIFCHAIMRSREFIHIGIINSITIKRLFRNFVFRKIIARG